MSDPEDRQRSGIGTLSERSLHASLIDWIAEPGDRFEVRYGRFVVDIVRDRRLIEIQTRHLGSMARKVEQLVCARSPMRVYHPLPACRWIVRECADGEIVGRRRSPKRAEPLDLFAELVHVPQWISNDHLTLRLLMVEEEEVRRNDGQGSWRLRGWSRVDRRLVAVRDEVVLRQAQDYWNLLPSDLPLTFTNRQLAEASRCTLRLAGCATYCLRQAGLLEVVGKERNAHRFERRG